MKLEPIQRYVRELGSARERHAHMREVFQKFRMGASNVTTDSYAVQGITITNLSPDEFTVQFLGKTVRFTFTYDHAALRGLVTVTTVSPDGESTGPNWSFHFDGRGDVGDIEPRPNEGNYNLGVDTDAAQIVLGALHIALVRQIEVV